VPVLYTHWRRRLFAITQHFPAIWGCPMPDPQWKGESNGAIRRRIQQIRWSRRDKIGAALMGVLVLLVALISAWLVSIYHD
jgi:hypothetical protein